MTAAGEAIATRADSSGRGSARRQQAIDAAAATFSRLGYLGASTRAIADALGIKVASLYFHVASKEDALREVCVLGMERSLLYLAQALQESDTLAGQLRHFFQHQRADLLVHADYVAVSIREGRHLTKENKRCVGELTAKFRAELDAMFALAADRGELHQALSPRHARFIMVGTMRAISELFISGSIRDLDDVMAHWIETVIRGVVARDIPPA